MFSKLFYSNEAVVDFLESIFFLDLVVQIDFEERYCTWLVVVAPKGHYKCETGWSEVTRELITKYSA